MGFITYSTAISESSTELTSRLADLKLPYLRDRCEVFLWLKTGKVRSMRQAMVLKNKHTNTGVNWWKLYQEGGLDALLTPFEAHRSSPLDELEEFWERLENEGFSQIKEAQHWLQTHFGLRYHEDSLGNYFRAHGIKCKTGRPHHPKKKEAQRVSYKKNMKRN